MRMVVSFVGLLIVVAIVGLLARKQLGSTPAPAPSSVESGVVAPSGTPQQQLRQVQKSIESAMQQARPMPEDESK